MVNTRSALLEVTINGELHRDMIPEDLTLLKYIRDYLGLTGTKCACNSAECGSCTVIVDGRAVYSCSMLAMQAYGRQVTTIEGLEQDGVLDPIQSAYIEAGAVHCGFCTPGFIMSTKALLDRNHHPSDLEIKEALAAAVQDMFRSWMRSSWQRKNCTDRRWADVLPCETCNGLG